MRPFSLVVFLLFVLSSCQTSTSTDTNTDEAVTLPNNVLESDAAFEKLLGYINSHYSNLDKNTLEVMEFDYSASVGSRSTELSSDISLTFVKGDQKDNIVA